MYVCMHRLAYVVDVSIYIYMCIPRFMTICANAYIQTWMYAPVPVYIYIYVRIHVYVYVCIHI